MSITLNPTLQTAQDSQSSHPICRIISSSPINDIPFDGSYLTAETQNEFAPNTIMTSTGRMITVYIESGVTYDRYIAFQYTDTAREGFTKIQYDQGTNVDILSCAICELSTGNIGLIWIETYLGNYRLRYMVVTPLGVVITAASTIQQWATASYTLYDPFVRKLADNSYLMVYGFYDIGAGTYSIQKRTSSDFSIWSVQSTCSVSGPSTVLRWNHPSLLQIDTGDIWLYFDHVDSVSGNSERINCYYSISADNGATWSAATALTNYTDYTASGIHPIAAQKQTNQMHVIFTEQRGALWADKDETGWDLIMSQAAVLQFDSVNRKIYVSVASSNYFYGIVRIDADTWVVDDYWDGATSPAISPVFLNPNWCYAHLFNGSGNKLCAAKYGKTERAAMYFNGEAGSIVNYYFDDNATYGITANTTGLRTGLYVGQGYVDAANNRLWLFCYDSYVLKRKIQIGYIDTSDPGPEYTFREVVYEEDSATEGNLVEMSSRGQFLVVPDYDYIIVSMAHAAGANKGRLIIYSISTGAQVKDYYIDTNSSMHYYGLNQICFYNGVIYGTFYYTALYSQDARRGLCKIDIATDTITYHRPSWASVNEYYLRSLVTTDTGEIVIASDYYGVTIYNPLGDTWSLINESSLPGLKPSGDNKFTRVAYDSSESMIIAGNDDYALAEAGVSYFSRYGFLKKSYYRIGTGPAWSFGSAAAFVDSWTGYNAVVALDPDDQSIYAFWTEKDNTELSIKWDKESSSKDITPYIINGTDVEVNWSIDNKPSTLNFVVSHGHLFDPSNQLSLLSIYLKRGRILTLSFGEEISGIEYWQNQGKFIVIDNETSYGLHKYPTMSIKAEDIRGEWDEIEVIATEYFEQSPEETITDILVEYADLVNPTDFNLPTFVNTVTIHQQWLETTLKEIVDDLCDRFGYFLHMDVDGKVTAKRIYDQNPVDHTYSDLTKIIEYSPDTSFSNFINQVTVTGEELSLTEVSYPEERVDSFGGTIGWWQGTQNYKRYYSQDKEKVCTSPRLDVIQTTASIPFKLAGNISEYISYEDPNGKYCEVTIDCPNLIPELAMLIGTALMAESAVADATFLHSSQTYVLIAIFYILGSVVNFQFDIYARPVGRLRRSIQSTANDTAFQTELGKIVSKKIDHPMAETVAQCQQIADHELMVCMLQRKRVKFVKKGHLQDEAGDTIKIIHPYNYQNLTLFITDLTRKFKKPTSTDSNDGYFLDEIQAWRVT